MKALRQLAFAGVGTAALIFLTGQARAAYVNYDVNIGAHDNINLTLYQAGDSSGPTEVNDSSALVGEITLAQTGGNLGQDLPKNYSTVCVDLKGTLYVPGNYGFSDATQFATGGNGIDPTWGFHSDATDAAQAIQHAADLVYTHLVQGSDWANDATHWAALQLSVWDALYDTTADNYSTSQYGLSSGRFRATGGTTSAITLADTWLSGINMYATYSGSLLIPDPTSQHNATAQELFINVTPVPEPTTVLAGALLLLPFGMSTLRRKARSA